MHLRSFKLQFIFLTGFVILGCKASSNAKVKTLATSSSLKTGFFKPKTKSEYSLSGKGKPMGVAEFVRAARVAANSSKLQLVVSDQVAYATTVNGDGEQLLVLLSDADIPLPVVSLKNGKLYSWFQHIIAGSDRVALSDLFVKVPYGGSAKNFTPEQMYVRRNAYNDAGILEALVVPWAQHVQSQQGEVVTFRMGNTMLDARTGKPVMEFEQVPGKPAWILLGGYKDKDVQAGSVFWKGENSEFYSLTGDSQSAVKWRLQDEDSMDRSGSVPLSSLKVPVQVREALARGQSLKDQSATLKSFDSYLGDAKVFQLDRNSMSLVSSSALNAAAVGSGGNGFSLAADSEEKFTDADYSATPALALGGWFPSNKPVTQFDSNDASGLKGASYTDETGQKHGGVILSSRNVWVPGGFAKSGNYEQRYYIANRTNNTVSEVRADGRSVRSGMPYDEFEGRVRSDVNIRNMQVQGGTMDSIQRQSNNYAQRSQAQLKRGESLLRGDTSWGALGNALEKAAVSQVTTQGGYEQSPLTSAGINSLGETYKSWRAGKDFQDGYQDVSSGLLVDTAKDYSKDFAKSYVGNQVWRYGKTATEATYAGKVSSAGVGAAFDAGDKFWERSKQGDFNPKDPDYYFNSRTSSAAVGGEFVKGAAGFITGQQAGGGRLGAAATSLTKSTLGTLFDGTESLSRTSYAQTLEKERSNLLESGSQVFRNADAGQEGVTNLRKIRSLDE